MYIILSLSFFLVAQSADPALALRLGLTTLPVNLVQSSQTLRLDGVRPSGAPLIQQMTVGPELLEPAISIGMSIDLFPWLTTSFQVDALLHSFASNQGKNGEVYGARVWLGAGYVWRLGPVTLSPGVSTALRFGGYGITSFDRAGQQSVTFGDSTFYDDDIGVHVVDVAWQLGPTLSAAYQVAPRWRIMLSVDYLWTAVQSSSVNIAGEIEDESVAWESVALDDPRLEWTSNGRRVVGPSTLPYTLAGPSAALLVLRAF
jgi:hypothetical protein